MRRPLKYLKAHSSLFIANVGNLGDTLPSGSKTVAGLKLEFSAEGVYIYAKDNRGTLQEALVPLSNVQIVTFAEPTTEDSSKKAE